jgi:hypothetical protein
MPGGKPRTRTRSKEEVIKLGEDLVRWATEETDEFRSRFCEWYTLEHDIIRDEWEAMLKLKEFRVYYEKARAALGKRYIDGTINPSIAHRLMWHYVPESREQEKEKMAYQAEITRKQEITQTVINKTEEIIQK